KHEMSGFENKLEHSPFISHKRCMQCVCKTLVESKNMQKMYKDELYEHHPDSELPPRDNK
ncbi:hypothetical protein L9F63_003319, partial [Diploptera punctata]